MRLQATRILTTLVILSTCLVLVLALLVGRQIDRATNVQSDRVGWRESIVGMTMGLERQTLLLRADLQAWLRRPTVDEVEQLRLRWELFASRVLLVRESQAGAVLAHVEHERVLARLDAIMAAGEPLFTAREIGVAELSAGLPRVLALLEEVGPEVQAYTWAASVQTTRRLEDQFAAVQQQTVLIGVLAGAQLLLMALVLQAARAGRRQERQDREKLQALNEQLQEAKVQAEAAARAKSQFLANMSHELRTPFQGVIGMLQILRGSPLSSQQSQVVGSALSSARHLLQVLNEVLDVSAIEAGRMTLRPEPFRTERLFAEVEALARLQAQTKGLCLEVQLGPGLPQRLRGDAMRIKQILFNLLNNAVKFTPAGGIRLKARSYELSDGETLLVIEVADTGIGIEPGMLERLFQRFETGDGSLARRHGGTGLGLEISRTLARLMGGDLVAHSRPGEGSTFVLTLRLGAAPGDEPGREDSAWMPLPDAAPAATAGPARPLKVLVADDHPINRQYLQLVLDGLGHAAVLVDNGEEAVEVVQTDDFDAVLMDVHMPVMDGLEATRRIRALGGAHARLPVIALSADVVADARERAEAAGATAFLAKPVDMEQLRGVFTALSQGGSGGAAQAAAATPAPAPADGLLSARFEALREQLPPASLAGLVRQFFDDEAGALRELRAAAQEADPQAVRLAAHKFKGSARMLGFDGVAAVAERIEQWSRDAGPPARLQALLAGLDRAVAGTAAEPAVAPLLGTREPA
jgi:signal transduction histidine kinase/DNA-binding NarL/FixJ family response regulator/HPt (histidine-containing phosphotransfer) domain-containing protein